MKQLLPAAWYSDSSWVKLLYPLSLLFGWLAKRRRRRLSQNAFQASVPVIVVGNITVGGTGKTPLTLALCNALGKAGYRPGIVSRGYGGSSDLYPLAVGPDTAVDETGDEAQLLAKLSGCPVVVDPVRARAVMYLETRFEPDVIICDDGLQHYALARQLEVVVIDGSRGLGNGLLLPAGPLREAPERLDTVDCVVINGESLTSLPAFRAPRFSMTLTTTGLRSLTTDQCLSLEAWREIHGTNKVHAVAGIGNPQRYFRGLEELGFVIIEHAYPDHHAYRRGELDFKDNLPVLMTEKDAVKYQAWAGPHHWSVQVSALLPESFCHTIIAQLQKLA